MKIRPVGAELFHAERQTDMISSQTFFAIMLMRIKIVNCTLLYYFGICVAKLSLRMCVSDIDVERTVHGLLYNALSHSSSGKTGRSAARQGTGDGFKIQVL